MKPTDHEMLVKVTERMDINVNLNSDGPAAC